jgi:hypothetical protein
MFYPSINSLETVADGIWSHSWEGNDGHGHDGRSKTGDPRSAFRSSDIARIASIHINQTENIGHISI